MKTTRIAIPAKHPGNLESARSNHFGDSRFFTLVDLHDGVIHQVSTVDNPPHGPGGCGQVVTFLRDQGVDTVIASSMGPGPFQKLLRSGFRVFFADTGQYPSVESAVAGLQRNDLVPMASDQLCSGGKNCHHA